MKKLKIDKFIWILFVIFLSGMSSFADECSLYPYITKTSKDSNYSWICFEPKNVKFFIEHENDYDDEGRKSGFCALKIIYDGVLFDFYIKGNPSVEACIIAVKAWKIGLEKSKKVCALGCVCGQSESKTFVVNWTLEQQWTNYAFKSDFGCTDYSDFDGICNEVGDP